MVRFLAMTARAVGLTYSILSTGIMIGFLLHGTVRQVRRRRTP